MKERINIKSPNYTTQIVTYNNRIHHLLVFSLISNHEYLRTEFAKIKACIGAIIPNNNL